MKEDELIALLPNSRPLDDSFDVRPGLFPPDDVIRTIEDAAVFMINIPGDHKTGIPWKLARNTLMGAAKNPANSDLMSTATRALQHWLQTEAMLKG
jgi:hypothetical protein